MALSASCCVSSKAQELEQNLAKASVSVIGGGVAAKYFFTFICPIGPPDERLPNYRSTDQNHSKRTSRRSRSTVSGVSEVKTSRTTSFISSAHSMRSAIGLSYRFCV